MKTDDLVTLLATGAEAVDPRAPVRRCAAAVAAGVLAAAVMMAAWLGVRGSLAQDVALPMLWIKFACGADAPQRSELFLAQTWNTCPLNIAVLSVPVFAAALWGMKGFAPTRPALAGAAAGLLAGAAGAVVYTFHCPELAAPFLGTWYVLGMLIPTALGAATGPTGPAGSGRICPLRTDHLCSVQPDHGNRHRRRLLLVFARP